MVVIRAADGECAVNSIMLFGIAIDRKSVV